MIDRDERRLALLVAGCFFMESLDGTLVSTSAPRIAADLQVSVSQIGLVVSAYLVTLAVLIPLSGWAVTRWGTRPVFLSAIMVFTVASLLCAASQNLWQLVAMRVVQGAGGALMVPVGRLAVLGRAAKADLMVLVSYLVWPGLVAPVVAPLAGGLITTYAGWRWLFLINVPLGVVAGCVARRRVPAGARSARAPLDRVGAALSIVGLGGLVTTATLASAPHPRWDLVAPIGVGAVLSIGAVIRHLNRTPDPLIDLSTLIIPTFRFAVGAGALFYLAISAVPFLLPLLFETVFGWSAVKAGAIVLFLFAGNIGIKPVVTPLLRRFGHRTVLAGAPAALAATMVCLGVFTTATPVILIAAVAALSGIVRSIGASALNTLIYADVPEARMTHANSLGTTIYQLAAGLGIAAATVALRAGVSIGRVLPGPETLASRYTVAFALLAILPLLAALTALRLHRSAGRAL